MTGREFLQLLRRYWRAERAFSYASRKNIVGLKFGRFGKKVGWMLIRTRRFRGINWVLVPVNSTRYFEFAFAQANIQSSPQLSLDVSSPALYGLYRAYHNSNETVHMINPDPVDMSATNETARVLNLANVLTQNIALHQLTRPDRGYDCIWSISVLEHINGDYDDRQSMKMLYELLRSRGQLIVTVPVDRNYWIEYRDKNYYGTQAQAGEQYFFQRFYDRAAIWERLLAPLGCEPSQLRWFGETENGRFHNYIKRWLAEGIDCLVDDPREIADHYREFSHWEEMPGVGVCGFVIEKP